MAQSRIWELITQSTAFGMLVLCVLALMSVISWAIMVSRWRLYRRVEGANARFMRVFRSRKRISDVYNELVEIKDSTLVALFEGTAIGVEAMTSPAACRTYNVLLAEGRRVALAALPV